MMRHVLVALVVAAVAGCASPPEAADDVLGADEVVVALACDGQGNAVPSLEFSHGGRCWGSYGQNVYLLPEPLLLHGANGTVGVSGITPTHQDAVKVRLESSVDGRTWSLLADVVAPGGSQKRDVALAAGFPEVPAILVRVAAEPVPSGAAAWIEGSAILLQGRAVHLEPLPVPSDLSCGTGFLEWVDSADPCDAAGVWAHTYLVDGAPRPFEARLQTHGRTLGYGLIVPAISCPGVDLPFQVEAHASPDGRQWTRLADAAAAPGADVVLAGDIPDGARLLRFSNLAQGQGCEGYRQPVAFSSVRLG